MRVAACRFLMRGTSTSKPGFHNPKGLPACFSDVVMWSRPMSTKSTDGPRRFNRWGVQSLLFAPQGSPNGSPHGIQGLEDVNVAEHLAKVLNFFKELMILARCIYLTYLRSSEDIVDSWNKNHTNALWSQVPSTSSYTLHDVKQSASEECANLSKLGVFA